MWHHLVPAHRAGRRRVQDARGRVIGRTEDLVLDMTEGRIAWAVVKLRRAEGLPHRRLLVPLARLQPMFDADAYVLDADRAALAGAEPIEQPGPELDGIRALG